MKKRTSPCSSCGSRETVKSRVVDGARVKIGLKCNVCRRVMPTWEGTLVEERKLNAQTRGAAMKLRAAARNTRP